MELNSKVVHETSESWHAVHPSEDMSLQAGRRSCSGPCGKEDAASDSSVGALG